MIHVRDEIYNGHEINVYFEDDFYSIDIRSSNFDGDVIGTYNGIAKEFAAIVMGRVFVDGMKVNMDHLDELTLKLRDKTGCYVAVSRECFAHSTGTHNVKYYVQENERETMTFKTLDQVRRYLESRINDPLPLTEKEKNIIKIFFDEIPKDLTFDEIIKGHACESELKTLSQCEI